MRAVSASERRYAIRTIRRSSPAAAGTKEDELPLLPDEFPVCCCAISWSVWKRLNADVVGAIHAGWEERA